MFLKAYYHSKRKRLSENFQRYWGTTVGEKVHTVQETMHPDKGKTEAHTDPHRPHTLTPHTEKTETQNKDTHTHRNKKDKETEPPV